MERYCVVADRGEHRGKFEITLTDIQLDIPSGVACRVKLVAGAPRRLGVGKLSVDFEDVLIFLPVELGLVGGCKPVRRVVREGEVAAKWRFK